MVIEFAMVLQMVMWGLMMAPLVRVFLSLSQSMSMMFTTLYWFPWPFNSPFHTILKWAGWSDPLGSKANNEAHQIVFLHIGSPLNAKLRFVTLPTCSSLPVQHYDTHSGPFTFCYR